MNNLIIFSDFDGTITERDAIVMTLERFAPPEWKDITHAILKERTLPVREGIQQLYALMPSTLREEIIRFVRTEVELRAGFDEFMAWRKAEGIPFYVVSGGLDAFIHPLLEPYAGDYQLFANVANFEAEQIRVEMPHAPEAGECSVCGNCACCKVKVLNRLTKPSEFYTVIIGDSVTDFGMAQVADKVFARAALAEEMKRMGIPYTPYESFIDIQRELQRLNAS